MWEKMQKQDEKKKTERSEDNLKEWKTGWEETNECYKIK